MNEERRTVVLSLDHKTVFDAVCQLALAEFLEPPSVGQRENLDLILEVVSTVRNLLTHLCALPLKPVGNMGELCFTVYGVELTEGVHLPRLATRFAHNTRARAGHTALRQTVGTLVQHFVQSLGAERLGDVDVVLLLPAILVVHHRLANDSTNLLGGFFFDLLGGEYLRHRGVQGNFSRFAVVPEWGVKIVAVVQQDDHRDILHLDHLAQGVGQNCRRTDGGIPRLRVHTHDIAVFVENLFHRAEERHIRGKFTLAHTPQPLHEERTAVIAVNGSDVVDTMGESGNRAEMEVHEVHMVAQKNVRRFQPLHIDFLNLVLLSHHTDATQGTQQTGE